MNQNGLLVGLDNTGKSVLLKQLESICSNKKIIKEKNLLNDEWNDFETYPTVGTTIETFSYNKETIQIREIGSQMLPMWSSYYSKSNYIIYMVDITNYTQIPGSTMEFFKILDSKDNQNKSILLLFNKMDVPCGIDHFKLKSYFGLDYIKNAKKIKFSCLLISALTGENVNYVLDWIIKLKKQKEI